jgi:Ca-activated chloride channel family protein
VANYLPLLLLVTGQCLSGQTAPTPVGPTISVDVNLVVLNASVMDRKGGFVSDLRREDVRVYEDGSPQAIRVFSHEDVPVAVGLVVDNSGSMRRKRQEVTAAALAFVHASNPRDQVFVVNFNERVSFGLPDTQLFSANPAELERALAGVQAGGRTALYDALEAGTDHLKKTTLDRKVLIAITDGEDNASRHSLRQLLEDAGRSDVSIYTIGLFDEGEHDTNPGVLKKIAQATGGEAFLLSDTSTVVLTCEQIAKDIRNQYTIAYIPSNPKLDDTQRTIKVTAAGHHGEKLVVRTRADYIASPARPKTQEGKTP